MQNMDFYRCLNMQICISQCALKQCSVTEKSELFMSLYFYTLHSLFELTSVFIKSGINIIKIFDL